MADYQPPQIPQDKIWELGIGSYVDTIKVLFRTLSNTLGPEKAREILFHSFYERGKTLGAGAPSRLGMTGNNAIEIATIPHLADEGMLIKGKIILATPDRVVKEITECPMKRISGDLCYAFEGLLKGMVEGINPGFKGSTPLMMGRGDPICRVVFERK